MPDEVLASGLMRWTRMRSRRGAMERIDLMADCGFVSGHLWRLWSLRSWAEVLDVNRAGEVDGEAYHVGGRH
jgi:hypothetical protein